MSFYDTILTPVFGQKPKVAKWKPLDLGKEQSKSIGSNITNFDQIAQLGDLYRKNMIEQQNALLPGYSENLAKGEAGVGKLLDVASSELSGELPPDVISQIERSDAFQSLQGGFGGSGMSRSLTARDLGLTSLDLMRQGASMLGQGGNSAQQWAAMARGDILNPASEFVTPQETAQFDMQNALFKQQSQQYAYNVAAAPDPVASGISNTIMSLVGAYLGGMGGGMMGGSKGGAQAGVAQYDQSNAFNEPWYMNAQNLTGG